MNSSLLAVSDETVTEAGRSRRALVLLAAVAATVTAAIVMLLQQASAASAQISIGSIVCPILRSLASTFSGFGFLAGLFNSLLSNFGC